jgi:hypothetical protein
MNDGTRAHAGACKRMPADRADRSNRAKALRAWLRQSGVSILAIGGGAANRRLR